MSRVEPGSAKRVVLWCSRATGGRRRATSRRATTGSSTGRTSPTDEPGAGAVVPHRDTSQSEHGFVSLVPWKGDRAAAVWLDGRQFVKSPGQSEGTEEMTLRYAAVGAGRRVPRDGDARRVRAAFSTDAAASFGAPIEIDDGLWAGSTSNSSPTARRSSLGSSGCPRGRDPSPTFYADGRRGQAIMIATTSVERASERFPTDGAHGRPDRLCLDRGGNTVHGAHGDRSSLGLSLRDVAATLLTPSRAAGESRSGVDS